jgi:hypothetical protein
MLPALAHCGPSRVAMSTSSPTAVERPLCPKCKRRMMLARIRPSGGGIELRSFECPNCKAELTLEEPGQDSLKAAEGWLTSELRPPE